METHCKNHECPWWPFFNLLAMKTALFLQFEVPHFTIFQEIANKQGFKADSSKHKLLWCCGHTLKITWKWEVINKSLLQHSDSTSTSRFQIQTGGEKKKTRRHALISLLTSKQPLGYKKQMPNLTIREVSDIPNICLHEKHLSFPIQKHGSPPGSGSSPANGHHPE